MLFNIFIIFQIIIFTLSLYNYEPTKQPKEPPARRVGRAPKRDLCAKKGLTFV